MGDKEILKFSLNSEVNKVLDEVEEDLKKNPMGTMENKLVRHKKNINDYTMEELSEKKRKTRTRIFCFLLTNLISLGILMYITFIEEAFTLREYLTIFVVFIITLVVLYDEARSLESYNLYIYLKVLESKIC